MFKDLLNLDMDNPLHQALKLLIDDGLAMVYTSDDTGVTMVALTDEGEKLMGNMDEPLPIEDDLGNEELEEFLKKADRELKNI